MNRDVYRTTLGRSDLSLRIVHTSVKSITAFAAVSMILATGLRAERVFARDSLAVDESAKVTVSRDRYDGLTNPNPHTHKIDILRCMGIKMKHTV